MTGKPYKTWRLFDSTDDAIEYRRERGTGGWIFSYADSGEAVLFPWQMTPKDVLESVFVQHHHGYLIGTDERRRPQDALRNLPATAPVLDKITRPTAI